MDNNTPENEKIDNAIKDYLKDSNPSENEKSDNSYNGNDSYNNSNTGNNNGNGSYGNGGYNNGYNNGNTENGGYYGGNNGYNNDSYGNGNYNNGNNENGGYYGGNNGYNNSYGNGGYNNSNNNGYNNGNYVYNYGDGNYNNQGYYGNNGGMQPVKQSNAVGITSMILGIMSVVLSCCCYPHTLIFGIAGVMLGIISLKKHEPSKGFAITGIITGGVGIAIAVVLIIAEIYMRKTGMYDKMYTDFIRRFCESMGIDPDDVLSEYYNKRGKGLY